jgi:hypothetical protein
LYPSIVEQSNQGDSRKEKEREKAVIELLTSRQ